MCPSGNETLGVSGHGGPLDLRSLLDLVRSVSPTLRRIHLIGTVITADSTHSAASLHLPRLTDVLLVGSALDPIVPHLAAAAAHRLQVVELRTSSSRRALIEVFARPDVPWLGMTFGEMRQQYYAYFVALLSRSRTDVALKHRECMAGSADRFVCGLWLSETELEEAELDSLRLLAGSQAPI
jgi:hypothetical protein